MKSYIKYIIILIIFAAYLFFDIHYVSADDNGVIGSNDDVGPCTNGYCYRGTVGIRVTVVDKDGNRLKLNGKESKSIDYWFDPTTLEGLTDPNCFAYNKKRTKKEFLNNLNTDGVVNCKKQENNGAYTGPYAEVHSITDLGFGKVDDNSYLSKWTDSSDGSIEKARTAVNINRIIDLLSCSQKTSDFSPTKFSDSNQKLNCVDLSGKQINSETTNNKYLNKIFQNAFDDNSIDVSKMSSLSGAYVQFEQLLQISNVKGSKFNGSTNFIVMGTVAEASYLYKNYMSPYSTRWCVVNPENSSTPGTWSKYNNKTVNNSNCKHSMSLGGYWSGWYGSDSSGIGLNPPSNNKHITDIGSYKIPRTSLISSKFDMDLFYSNDTSNLFSFWINPSIAGSCDTEAKSYISSNSNPTIDGLKNYLSAKNIKDLEGYHGPTNNEINIADAKFRGIINSTNESQLGDKVSDYCSNISCSDILSKTSKTKENLTMLYNTFPNNDFLNPEVLDELGIGYNGAKCEGTPECPVTTQEFKCSNNENGNSLTLSDTKNSEDISCISKGIAYNGYNNGGTFVKKNVQSSYDFEYGTADDPGYCWESVTFDFPGNASTTAGRLLEWGKKEEDTQFRKFGTMTVRRKCYLSNSWNSDKITSDWADVGNSVITANTSGYTATHDARINPTIQLNYVQAVPEAYRSETKTRNYKVTENLKVYLSKFTMTDNKNFDDKNSVEYDINGQMLDGSYVSNNHPRTISCTNNCKTNLGINWVDMTATYQIVYDNNLYWYSDKADNFGYKTTTDENILETHPSYEAIGYGLPTSFVTPSTPIDKHYGYDYALNSDEDGGKLSVSVSNIGTMNKNKTTYHFDKMITYALTDDDPNISNSIVYSCGFDIENELYGYECGDHGEKCNNTCTNPPCDNECPNGVCDSPKGIDVVFRTVDLVSSEDELSEAFPGRSGTGRDRGRNWAKLSDTNVTHILRNSVYDNEPMYEITLTAGKIQKIRSLNKALDNAYSDMTVAENNGSSSDGYKGYTYYKYRASDSSLQMTKCSYLYPDENSKEREDCDAIAEAMLEDYGDASTGGASSLTVRGPVASNFIKHLIEKGSLTGRCATQSDNSRRIENILSGCEG